MSEIKHEVRSDGTRLWTLNGLLHRTDGPAVIARNGLQLWYYQGVKHRMDGPAVICDNGTQAWFYLGAELTFAEWLDRAAISPEHRTMLILRWSKAK